MRTRALAGLTAGLALATVATTTAPAYANDKTMLLKHNGDVVAKATWDDLTDNLCITVYGGAANFAEVGILSHYRLPEPDRATRKISNYGGRGRVCTGNLSIREDALYDMYMRWYNRNTGQATDAGPQSFYT